MAKTLKGLLLLLALGIAFEQSVFAGSTQAYKRDSGYKSVSK